MVSSSVKPGCDCVDSGFTGSLTIEHRCLGPLFSTCYRGSTENSSDVTIPVTSEIGRTIDSSSDYHAPSRHGVAERDVVWLSTSGSRVSRSLLDADDRRPHPFVVILAPPVSRFIIIVVSRALTPRRTRPNDDLSL